MTTAVSPDSIRACGRLKTIYISYCGQDYAIRGVSDIVAVPKRRGHGRILVTAIQTHLEQNGLTGVGFCNRETNGFYEKCGFRIIKNGGLRFAYGGKHSNADVLYHQGMDGFIDELLETNEPVTIKMPHW